MSCKIILGHKYFYLTCFPQESPLFEFASAIMFLALFGIEPVVLDNLAVIKGSFIRHRLTLW